MVAAGDRRRAIDIARARGAWAATIDILRQSDPMQARALRSEWVAVARAAGDHRLAVEAAWPDEQLRPSVEADLAVLRERGGRLGARALARQLALRADAAARDDAAALIDGRDELDVGTRAAFIDELAALRLTDPSTDRQLATASVRALLRDGATPAR